MQARQYTLHSLKTTYLSWMGLLSIPVSARFLQGHHRIPVSAQFYTAETKFGRRYEPRLLMWRLYTQDFAHLDPSTGAAKLRLWSHTWKSRDSCGPSPSSCFHASPGVMIVRPFSSGKLGILRIKKHATHRKSHLELPLFRGGGYDTS